MRKILVFQHVAHEHPGFFFDAARLSDTHLEIVRLWEGDRIHLHDDFSGLIILGGPQSVYDPIESYPSREDELGAIRDFMRAGKPVLGLCLGSQLIAHALGGRVYRNVVHGRPVKETGYVRLSLTDAGKNSHLLDGFPDSFDAFEWHGDVFDIPQGAQVLVKGGVVEFQAFLMDSAAGLLFHTEFMPEMVEEMIKIDGEWMRKDNRSDERVILSDAHRLRASQRDLALLLFRNWMMRVP